MHVNNYYLFIGIPSDMNVTPQHQSADSRQVHRYMHVQIHACTDTCTDTYIHTYIHTYIP